MLTVSLSDCSVSWGGDSVIVKLIGSMVFTD